MNTALGAGTHRRSVAGKARAVTARDAPAWFEAQLSDRALPFDLEQSTGIARRAVNIVLALLAIVVAMPLMLLIALLVKLTSPGPVIFKQSRVGVDRRDPFSTAYTGRRRVDYGGRLFTIYKFRTMTVQSDPSVQVWARPDDARVTPLGRLLRTSRLDELPQLFNVLKGDMNIVGPRPEQPKIFMDLRERIDLYPHRQRVLPGITGWAQINHHYDASIEDVRTKIRYDLDYITRASVVHDLYILARTVPVVLFRKGGW
jgi:lipopolysaccharide/colanic/teichoic acid biosynthesis glycosyltransferase